MRAARVATAGIRNPGNTRRGRARALLACAAAVLAVAGCTPGAPPAPADTSAVSTPAASSPAASAPASSGGPGTGPAAEKALSDEELMGLMDRAIKGAPQNTGRVAQTADLRARLRNEPAPADLTVVEPGECGVFRPRSSPTSNADLEMNFAAGVLTLTGSWTREALAFVLARSAPLNDVVATDFKYPEELPGKCATFRQTAPHAPPVTVRLLPVHSLGEKAYAVYLRPPATTGTPPAAGTVALQVLAGTVSFGLSRQAPTITSDEDVESALAPLLRLAEKLVAEAHGGRHPATAPATPTPPRQTPLPQAQVPPRQTPEQLATLLQGITGPHGSPAQVLQRRYAPPPPAAPPPADSPACVYDDAAYLASLAGAATVVAEIPGAGQQRARTSLRLASLPSAPGPIPFDRRAADLGRCTSMQELLPQAGTRAWLALEHPAVDTSGPVGYAVVYTLPDGAGVRHVMVGARKGTLCIEAETTAPADDSAQSAADRLAALINKVMAKVSG